MTNNIQNISNDDEKDYLQLPNNLDAEQQLLGALLINNDLYDRVSNYLRGEHFYESIHGFIYENISKLILGN
ncbi:MAG: DnaB-like helicase N-terminal domain-containing protein [Hyphomicrobiales bacterium]